MVWYSMQIFEQCAHALWKNSDQDTLFFFKEIFSNETIPLFFLRGGNDSNPRSNEIKGVVLPPKLHLVVDQDTLNMRANDKKKYL